MKKKHLAAIAFTTSVFSASAGNLDLPNDTYVLNFNVPTAKVTSLLEHRVIATVGDDVEFESAPDKTFKNGARVVFTPEGKCYGERLYPKNPSNPIQVAEPTDAECEIVSWGKEYVTVHIVL